MGCIDNKFAGSVVLFISLLFLVSLGAAEFEIYKGDSVTLEKANTKITWGQNYTFDVSSLGAENDTLSIGSQNISISSNTTDQVNATLWKYNLTGPYHEKTAVKLEVSAVNSSNVTVFFDSLPGFTYGRYELSEEDSLMRNISSGGEITWHEADWSTHNYTVTYYKDTGKPGLSLSFDNSIKEGDSIKISCSASDKPGIKSTSLTVTDPDGEKYNANCGQEFEETGLTGEYTVKYSATDKAGNSNSVSKTFDVTSSGGGSSGGGGIDVSSPSDSHSWVSTSKDRFSFESIDEDVGVRSVSVFTDRNLTGFEITVSRLNEEPDLPDLPENTYNFYEFTVGENEDSFASTEVRFSVDRSFAEEHDDIVISRYDNSWEDLQTELTDIRL